METPRWFLCKTINARLQRLWFAYILLKLRVWNVAPTFLLLDHRDYTKCLVTLCLTTCRRQLGEKQWSSCELKIWRCHRTFLYFFFKYLNSSWLFLGGDIYFVDLNQASVSSKKSVEFRSSEVFANFHIGTVILIFFNEILLFKWFNVFY